MLNIYQILSDSRWSGPEQYAYDLTAQMKSDNQEFYTEIVTQNRPAIIERFRQLEVPVSILPLKSLSDLDSPVRLARQIKRGKNILHVHNMKDAVTAVFACKISENPLNRVVLTSHSVERPKTSIWYRRVLKEINHIVFVSQVQYDEFIDHAKRFDRKRASVIHDSIRPLEADGQVMNLRKDLNIADSKTLIMFHGRVCKEKGIDVLVEALSQLNKDTFHLVVIGEGNKHYTKKLKALIDDKQLADNITMMGYQPNLQQLIAQADFGVLPAAWREPFGISNLEYMMQGKAHISTNNGGQVEYLRHFENALLVEPENPSSLASAIQRLIDDKQLRNDLGIQAKDDFDQHLTYKHFYEKIISLYNSL